MFSKPELRTQRDYVKNLSETKLVAIKKYTEEAYGPINDALLVNREIPEKCKEIVRELDEIFEQAPPLTTNLVVYRGVTKRHDFGKLAGFISTSIDYDMALSFASINNQCCVFIITIPKGAKALPIDDVSVHEREGEILLPRSGHFEVTKTGYNDGMETFYLDLVLETASIATSSKKILSDDEIVLLILNNVLQEDVDLFGVDDAIRSVAFDLEKLIGVHIKDSIVQRAIKQYTL
jgi:hypothetical protein